MSSESCDPGSSAQAIEEQKGICNRSGCLVEVSRESEIDIDLTASPQTPCTEECLEKAASDVGCGN
jgi:hypothetical protein